MKNLNKKVEKWDGIIIEHAKRIAMPVSRFAIFLVYFWFGILKVLGTSPASPLVVALLNKTMPSISPVSFLIFFGLVEIVIGILFIIPKLERLAIFALALHLITTIMPLFLLPQLAWHGFLIPTMEGQYIIKNILIVALAIVVVSNLHPYYGNQE